MSVADAIHRAVHEYPGGAEPLAIRMGLGAQTLRNMADPNQATHNWSLRRFRELVTYASTAPLQELCREHGGMFVPLGPLQNAPTSKLLKAMQKLAAEFGDVPREIEKALDNDGRITGNELKDIQREILELVQAASLVMQRVEEIHQQRSALPDEERP